MVTYLHRLHETRRLDRYPWCWKGRHIDGECLWTIPHTLFHIVVGQCPSFLA